jgi:uncharacterized membrane protein YdfJ with MMPL/SSD domain
VPLASLIAALTLQPALLSYFGKHFATPVKYPGLLADVNLKIILGPKLLASQLNGQSGYLLFL